ncbi:radical SAM protein [Desulfitobacterium sp.]|uniref:radical SAM protein n=1 Tax=Desulfitobacterium sp. TaxID=49981 RepID=UPI002C80BD01|nr:radical SAM protein [Desulfitobacterium sp.]HVJ48226.1 radical SAM protein [Desulfitobacterium sp.]
MIRCSLGTAKVLGLRKVKVDALPTTAYLLLGERCKFNCAFCAQARESGARADLLSRVSWPDYQDEEFSASLKGLAAEEADFHRLCFQVVQDKEALQEVKKWVSQVKTSRPELPVCVSAGPRSIEEIGELIHLGAEHVSIALDAATPEIFAQMKDGSWDSRYLLLTEAAAHYPGHLATHLIVGLGETEEEMLTRIQDLQDRGIIVALFAFTPVKGTRLEKVPQPKMEHYRRIQAGYYLVRKGLAQAENFRYAEGKVVSYGLALEQLKNALQTGEAFRTSGCPDCNRPYFNETPGEELYNYPRPLLAGEIDKAWQELTRNLQELPE